MKYLAFILFFPLLALAQSHEQYEDLPAPAGDWVAPTGCKRMDTATAQTSTDGDMSLATCDQYGQQLTVAAPPAAGSIGADIPISNNTNLTGPGVGVVGWYRQGTDLVETSSTTTVINLTAHAARAGDMLGFTSGTAANIGAWSPIASVATNTVTLSNALPATPANGDGVTIFRPVPIASNGTLASSASYGGALMCGINADYQASTASGILKYEDGVASSGDAGVMVLEKTIATVAASSTTNLDYVTKNQDERGLSYTNSWGAGFTEWFRVCSASDVTGTTATEIQPATASKYTYLTAVNCTNTDATVNTRVNIVQETAVATEILWMLNLPAIVGSDGMKFDPPLKATAVNKNIGVTPITTSAEVRCCVEGFVSAL